jgi:hypothetical protein
MRQLVTVAGMLRYSSRFDYFLEADSGGYWLLDVPFSRTEEIDALLYSRVTVRGVRSGYAELYVFTIEEQQD